MLYEFSIKGLMSIDTKEKLLVVAQERYPGNQQSLLKYLVEVDVLSLLCSKLNTEVYFVGNDTVMLGYNPFDRKFTSELDNVYDAALEMNHILKAMSYAISKSVALFTNQYRAGEVPISIRHLADNMLVDTYLRKTELAESGVARYAFYADELKPYYPDFLEATKLALHLFNEYNRGNEAYNSFAEETYRPIYNNGLVGVTKHAVQKNEEMLSLDIRSRVLDILGADIGNYDDEQRDAYNQAFRLMSESPYSACYIMSSFLENMVNSSPDPLKVRISQLFKLIEQNRTLVMLLQAYSKHLSWFVKEVNNSAYALLHHLLMFNSEQYKPSKTDRPTALPEQIFKILETGESGMLDGEFTMKDYLVMSSTYRNDMADLLSIFKQFKDAAEYYGEIEKLAKSKGNDRPIADVSSKKYLHLFHNPELSPEINFKDYRDSLVG